MKFLKLVPLTGLAYALILLFTTSPQVSCTKTYTDSTLIISHIVKRDTTIVNDTTVVRDTIIVTKQKRTIH